MEDAVLEKVNEGEHCVTFSCFVNGLRKMVTVKGTGIGCYIYDCRVIIRRILLGTRLPSHSVEEGS